MYDIANYMSICHKRNNNRGASMCHFQLGGFEDQVIDEIHYYVFTYKLVKFKQSF
mgnify:CR=1